MRAGLELRNVVELFFGDSGFSADGRMDVDSKRAADHEGGFELRELFEVHGNDALSNGVPIHAGGVAEIFWIEGADARTAGNASQKASQQEKDEAGDGTSLIVLDALGAWHE